MSEKNKTQENNQDGYSKKKAILKCLLKVLQVEFFGIFVFLFFTPMSKAMGTFANVMFGFMGVFTVICIMADFGLKEGEIARKKVKFHNGKVGMNFGYILGALAMLPTYLTAVLLVLSKLKIIGNFLPAYKILNPCFYPFFDLAAHSPQISEMSDYALIIPLTFPLLFMFATGISFRISYKNIDLKDKIIYN